MYRKRFAVKNLSISCLTSIFDQSNQKMKITSKKCSNLVILVNKLRYFHMNNLLKTIFILYCFLESGYACKIVQIFIMNTDLKDWFWLFLIWWGESDIVHFGHPSPVLSPRLS